MALSTSQKLLRAITLGSAVKRLREELGLSQEGLVAAVGHKLDAGMVSRWERAAVHAQQPGLRSGGTCSPSPEWRKFLASFARRRGCLAVAAAFEEPLHEWKQVVLSAEDRRLLALFEIAVLNKPPGPEAWPEVVPWKTYLRLVRSIEDVADCLKKNQGRTFQMKGQTRSGAEMKGEPFSWGAVTLTDEQRVAWLRETNPRAKALQDDQPDNLVFRYGDGRIEILKDEPRKESIGGKTKKSTRRR